MESIQGEGLLIGTRQIFIRFQGCNQKCLYCDTPRSRGLSSVCKIYNKASERDNFDCIDPHLDISELSHIIKKFSSPWISFTGGEPLLWSTYIAEFIKQNQGKYKYMLESNGTLYDELDECLPYLDLISMDFKLESSSGINCLDAHKKFIEKAIKIPTYIKAVISSKTNSAEIKTMLDIITSHNKDIPLILQPVTARNDVQAIAIDKVMIFQEQCLEKLSDVRVIPQIHPFLDII